MFGPSFDRHFTVVDKDLATKVATKYWHELNDEAKQSIQELVDAHFELWKYKYGEVDEQKVKTDEARLSYLESHEAWECAPYWCNNPIDLFSEIMFNNEEAFLNISYISVLSWLILLCEKKKNDLFWQPMIRVAFWLSENDNEYQSDLNKKLTPLALKRAKQNLVLAENNFKQAQEHLHEVRMRKKIIHKKASELLSEGKSKRLIASMIYTYLKKSKGPEGKYSVVTRQIRRDLVDHPSGLWKKR